MKYKNNRQEKYKKVSCPKCKSEEIIKRGQRKTENRGLIQRFSCKNCGHRFVIDDGFFRMRNAPQKVTLSIDLFYRGISTREIQSHLQSFFPHNSSHMTIYRWIVKYAKMISQFTDNLKIKVGKELQVDEMEIGSKRSRYNGWFIDSIDTETRFMVASKFAKSRDEKTIKKVLGKAKQKSENKFKIITTDGYMVYDKNVKSVFGYYHFQRGDKFHNVITQLKGEGFNHKIERLHNNIRHRIKTFRGLHSIINSNEIMQGFQIYYNFIRKHQAIDKCPYELATDLKLSPENKWLQLIKLAIQNNLK